MLDRTLIGKVSAVAGVFFLLSIFLAFGVVGDDVVGGDVNAETVVEDVVELPETVEELVVETENADSETGEGALIEANEEIYIDVEEVVEVVEAETEDENSSNELYVNLDEVLEDNGVEEVAEVEGEEVYIDLENVSEEIINEDVAEIAEEKELTQSFTGVVEIAGELERREIMKITYLESQAEVVSTIERKEEVVLQDDEQLKKEVVVSSEGHFDNEIVYYSYFDVEVADKDLIKLNWKNENREIDFDVYDENENGLIDGISWVIPHLSEQEFEITVDFTFGTDLNLTVIEIEEVEVPTNVTQSPVEFDFVVSYNNISAVLCNFSLSDLDSLLFSELFSDTDSISHVFDLSNGEYSWDVYCFDLTNETINTETSGTFLIAANYTPTVKLTASPESIWRGQVVGFGINVSAPPNSYVDTIKYKLHYGDSGESSGEVAGQLIFVDSKTHNYTSTGNFVVNLTGTVRYVGDNSTTLYSLSTYKTIVVSEPPATGDSEAPKIRLIEPDDEKYFEFESREQKIKFSFNVTDNVKIANCTFEMFYYNDSLFGEEIITEFKSDITNGSTISYEYKDFDEGDYSWDVECYDNSSNRGDVNDRDFYVSYEDEESSSETTESKKKVTLSSEEQTRISEVQTLIDAINDFFVEEEKYSPDQIEAIGDLEIDEALKFYKKKLLQMKLDLEHNLDYIQEADRRDARRQEILSEMAEMKKNIPVSVGVRESKEYYKSSLETDLEEVIHAYAEVKGLVIDNRGVREMAKQNELLQNQITVSVNAKTMEIRYLDGNEEEFVLVSKKIDFKSKDFDSLIEVIPKEVVENADDVSFVVVSSVLKQDPILEIKLSDLGERDKIVYKINRLVGLGEIEKTTTLAFKEDVPESTIGGISGFVSLIGGDGERGIGFYLSWLLVAAAVVVIGAFSYRKIKIGRLKRHKDVRALFMVTSETERLLKAMDIEKARAKYYEAQALYSKIPEHGKKHIYKKLQKLYLAIDKKDIASMVREFIAASKEGRRNDALMIYGNIQKLYPRMPKGFKERVFEKLQPHLDKLRDSKI